MRKLLDLGSALRHLKCVGLGYGQPEDLRYTQLRSGERTRRANPSLRLRMTVVNESSYPCSYTEESGKA